MKSYLIQSFKYTIHVNKYSNQGHATFAHVLCRFEHGHSDIVMIRWDHTS